MVVQLQLCNLVDLALCDPEIGAVNFNHLRTLLHCMLKLTDHANSFVEPTSENNSSTIINNNVESDLMYCEQYAVIGTSVVQEGEPKVSLNKDNQEVSCINSLSDREHIKNEVERYRETEFNRLLLNQNNLETRILSLEKNLQANNEEFPSNYEILNGNYDECEEMNTSKNEDDSKKEMSNNRLGKIWQNKKILRRIECTEESIDKLFSLMDDILSQDKLTRSDYENMRNQLVQLQNHLDQYTQGVSNCEADIQSNKSLIEKCLYELGDLGEYVNGKSSNLEEVCTDKQIEEKSSGIDMHKLGLMLHEKADLCEVDNKANTSTVEIMQNGIIQLTAEVNKLKEKVLNLKNNSDIDTDEVFEKVDMKKLVETMNLHVTTTDNSFSEIRTDLAELRQIIVNIDDDDTLRDVMENIGELWKLSDKREDMYVNQRKMEDVLIQMEQYEKLQNEMTLKLDDLNKANENMINSQSELRMLIPTFDASVVAAIQHLTQENRHQITDLQTNVRMLQKLQMSIQPAVPKNDTSGNSCDKLEMLEILQNHILTLQEVQVKQSSHISNMVDDYKEEFNRKQLHIDALYEYIDKLQHIKADKDEITVEMNIKADKQSLDNKVNMSTFDERYQMLEQSLQQALSRLDEYVEEESVLKSEFSKLSEDMNSKMDSDAERKLKKFLNARLKEIQVSRTHLNNECDLRNAAGLRKPMPLSYNCLSCDRPIDVTMRGVMPPVPNYLPSKKPLCSIKHEKDEVNQSKRSSSPFNSMVVNRSCGGSHTSVNINMLRMIKLNPLQNVPDSHVAKTSGKGLSIADCVIGNDGQIYRGRFKLRKSPNHKQNKVNGRENKQRITHSASTRSKHTDTPKIDDRSHSATCIKIANACEKTFCLPPITHEFDSVL